MYTAVQHSMKQRLHIVFNLLTSIGILCRNTGKGEYALQQILNETPASKS